MSVAEISHFFNDIYLVSHAEAMPESEWTGGDLTRPLTANGVRQAVARGSDGIIESSSILVTSHTLRAAATLMIMIGPMMKYRMLVVPELYPSAGSDFDRCFKRVGRAAVKQYVLDGEAGNVLRATARTALASIWTAVHDYTPRVSLVIAGHSVVNPGIAWLLAEMRNLRTDQIMTWQGGRAKAILVTRDCVRFFE